MKLRLGKKDQGKSVPGSEEFEKGLSFWDEDKYSEALEEFKKAESKGFKKDSIENDIGACYEKLGRIAEAREHYENALKNNPYNFFVLRNYSQMLMAEGEIKKAMEYLTRAHSLDPNDQEIRISLASALVDDNQTQKGVKLLKPVLKKSYPNELMIEALSIMKDAGAYEDILEIESSLPKELIDNAEVISLLGEAYFEIGDGQKAVQCFEKLSEKKPDVAIKSWLGLSHVAAGNEQKGLDILRQAEKEAPKNPEVLQNLAFGLHGSDRLEEALDVYDRILTIQPDDWILWNNWGNALYNLKRYPESIPKFVVALEKNPDYEISWNNIGNALEKMHLYPESLPFHKRAIEIDERFAYAHYAASVALIHMGRDEEAKIEMSNAVSLRPSFPEAWIAYAKILLASYPGDAINYARTAAEMDSESAEPLAVLAMAQANADLDVESEETLRKAKALAEELGDSKSLALIQDVLEHGKAAIVRFEENDSFARIAGSLKKTNEILDQDAMEWFNLGTELMQNKEKEKALGAFKIYAEHDQSSPTAIAMILRLERDRKRMQNHLLQAKKLRDLSLSTPTLERSIVSAEKRLAGAQARMKK